MRTPTVLRWLALWLGLAVVLGGCADPDLGPNEPLGVALLQLDGRPIELTTTACDLGDRGFRAEVPDGATERTLTAEGTDPEGRPVAVAVRRSAGNPTYARIETVEVTLGDPAVAVTSLVLYRAYDTRARTWTEIDADAPDGRRSVAGPLLALSGTRLVAQGTAAAPSDGRPLHVRLQAACPVTADEPPGLAVG